MGGADSFLDDLQRKQDQGEPATAQPQSGSDAFLSSLESQQKGQLRASLNTAAQVDPDQAAKVKRLADVTGLPVDIVSRNHDQVAAAQRAQEIQQITAQDPILRRQMSDPEFAKIAHDDTSNLSIVGGVLKSFQSMLRNAAAGATFDISSAGYGLAETTAKTLAPLLDPLEGRLLPENPLRRAAEGFEKARKNQQNMADVVAGGPATGGFIEQGIKSGFRSTGQMAPGLVASVLTGNPTYALTAGGLQQGSQSATKALDAGKTPLQAASYGFQDAVAEVVTEKLPLGVLLKDLKAGSGVLKTMGHQIATEIPSELAATAWQNANEWAALHPEKTIKDYLAELGPDEAQTVIATITQSVLTAGMGKAAHAAAYRQTQAKQADQHSQVMDQLMQLAEASKVRERDPSSFQNFVSDAAQDGPVQNIFVPAQTFAQAAGEKLPELAAAMPSVADQMKDALQSGGDLVIPVGEFTTHIPGSGLEKSLMDHIRTAPDAMSRAEAHEFMQSGATEMQAQAEQVLEGQEFDSAIKESRDSVERELLAQLNTANRFTPEVNTQYAKLAAAFYTVQAARLGITPEQMYVQYPLQVNAASPAQSANALDQEAIAKQVINSQAFKKWFADSQVKDEHGNPLVVYHGTTGDFNAFSSMHKGANTLAFSGKAGFWFTNSTKHSSDFASEKSGGNVMPVYLSLKNPLVVQNVNDEKGRMAAIDRAKAGKHDGVIFKNSEDTSKVSTRNTSDLYLAFNESDIKSAVGNRGTFDPNTPNVLHQDNWRELAEALSKYDDTGEYTGRDLLAHVSALIDNGQAPSELERVAQGYADALREDDEIYSGRGDTETHEDAFVAAVRKAVNSTFEQQQRGQISFGDDITKDKSIITLLQNADLSTFVHELGHFQLEVLNHIASDPTAPAEIRGDMDALLKWFNVPGASEQERLMNWNSLSLDEKRPMHEQLARGFEAYMFEGNAPSVELQGVFSRIRAWMINVYRQLSALNVTLTDQVRGVFDRLIATNEEILAAEQQRGYTPLFKSAEEMGATQAEWKAYQEQGINSTQKAIDELQTRSLRDMKWLSNARSKVIKDLQREAKTKRAEVEAEVTAEVQSQPIYAAQRFIKENKTKHEDYAPVAELFGFTSKDHLTYALGEAQPEAAVIEGMTDQRMLERYGDLTDPKSIEDAADHALHNEARAKFITTELRALDKAMKATQKTPAGGSVNVLRKAAKQFAEQIIARKRVRDVKPSQYSAAEARAGRAAERAKSLVEKATEKRNQLVNHYAARAAYKAVDDVHKGVEYLKKVANNDAIDISYRDQIQQMLERFDLRSGQSLKAIDKRTSLANWIKQQEEQGFEPTIDDKLRDETFRKSFKDMTVEEVRGLIDAVKNIEHLGRLKQKLLTVADARDFAAVVDEIVTSIENNATGTVAERRASDRGALVAAGKLFRNFLADHRKFASLAREMDGWQDAGKMWDYLVANMNKAGDTEAVMREQATIKLGELLTPVLSKGKKALGEKQYFPSSGKSFTYEERLGIALNMGNEINRERVVTGEKLTPQALNDILDTLTQEDWNFVQATWDYLDSFRPQIAAKERRLTGAEPEWVQASPITTKFGEYKGGYYPIKYDAERSSKSEADSAAEVQRQIERGLYTRAQTRRGHLKERVESTGRPLNYSLSVLPQHVDQVIHDLAWHEYLIDANRLMRAAGVDEAIRTHYGPEKLRTMKETLTDIAVGDIGATSAFERILNKLRHNATIAGLGWRLTTSLAQPLGLTQSIVRIGPKWVAKGAMHWLGDATSLESSFKKIADKSDFMRLRAKTMQREINEIRNKVSGKESKLEASYFYLIQKMQLVADIPTWWGAYEKAMAEDDMKESKAIALADQAVRDAQGHGQIGDLAAIQRGGAGKKLFTSFYSFFNTTYNLTRESIGRTDFRSPKDVALLGADMLLLYSIPAILQTLMKAALGGDWDDEKKLYRRLIADQLNYLFGTMVGLREFNGAIQASVGLNGDYQGPASVRFVADAAKLAKQVNQGEADEAFWKALNNMGGSLFGYPSGQINSTLSGLNAMSEGRTQNPGALVVGAPHK